MSSRSLNKVLLIGNLTRDPELRYTPQGTAVCTIGLATNRSWTTGGEGGEKNEQVEFHRLVAWSKLAEICGQLLKKGRKVFVEGRLQTREWTTQDGQKRQTTEIVMENMILLDSANRGGDAAADAGSYAYPADDQSAAGAAAGTAAGTAPAGAPSVDDAQPAKAGSKAKGKKGKVMKEEAPTDPGVVAEDISDDIPF